MMESLDFYKMSGAGNDFILADDRQGAWSAHPLPRLAVGLCRRGMSVGADGLILLENSNRANFRVRIFNSDGSDGVMCGNGARCAARFAFLRVITGRRMTMETGAGVIGGEILPDGRVRVEIPGLPQPPRRLDLQVQGRSLPGYLTHTGVPHLVVFVKDAARVPVASLGAALRHAVELGPQGANVDFVALDAGEPFPMRSFERGVEGETLACGTGAVAVAWVLKCLGRAGDRVRLLPRSGRELTVDILSGQRSGHSFQLTGEAVLVYRGTLSEEAVQEALACSRDA